MEKLAQYLYTKYLSSNQPNIQSICKFEPFSVANENYQKLQLMLPFLIRNIFSYSASKLEVKLSPQHLFMYQRQQKIQSLMKAFNFHTYYTQWIQNQLLPFKVSSNKKIPNTPFIFIDKSKEQQGQKQKKQDKTIMLNVLEITKELQARFACKILNISQEQYNESKVKDQLIDKVCWRKVEEYINELFGQNTLMVFNFINKSPYIDEKELLRRTMLPLLQLRISINNLVTSGLINFYQENARTMLYKMIPNAQIYERYLNHICQTILNLHIYVQKGKGEQQNKNSCYEAISNLDDILILFGY